MSPVLHGEVSLPGDKSISHRALMLLGLAQGAATLRNLSDGQDVQSTMRCMAQLGCDIQHLDENDYRITGRFPLKAPTVPLDCGNSGTTIRLLSGILAGSNCPATLTGDESLQKRPMKRIIDPLTQMGANITALGPNGCAPLQIKRPPGGIQSIHYTMPMASAQVKSAILLAGLFAPPDATIQVEEPLPSRDHTERMLTALGAEVTRFGQEIRLIGRHTDLVAQDMIIPGDISSAAFWIVGAAILPGSRLRIRQVGLNPTRIELLNLLRNVIHLSVKAVQESAGEPYGDLLIEGVPLKGDLTITPEQVPGLIDEIPILTILGLFTQGRFTLRGAEELRYKESDRLNAMIALLQQLRIEVTPYDDGFSFQGDPHWQVPCVEAPLQTRHDHRLVMALEILNLRATQPLPIEGKTWASISYPGFFHTLERLLNAGSGVSG